MFSIRAIRNILGASGAAPDPATGVAEATQPARPPQSPRHHNSPANPPAAGIPTATATLLADVDRVLREAHEITFHEHSAGHQGERTPKHKKREVKRKLRSLRNQLLHEQTPHKRARETDSDSDGSARQRRRTTGTPTRLASAPSAIELADVIAAEQHTLGTRLVMAVEAQRRAEPRAAYSLATVAVLFARAFATLPHPDESEPTAADVARLLQAASSELHTSSFPDEDVDERTVRILLAMLPPRALATLASLADGAITPLDAASNLGLLREDGIDELFEDPNELTHVLVEMHGDMIAQRMETASRVG